MHFIDEYMISHSIPVIVIITGEIITTPFSYVATTSSIVWEGCTPVFVDIHPDFLTIDESKIETERSFNYRITILMGVLLL